MKKEVLIITSYFPPEIGAASNRIYQLSKGLNDCDFDVTVLTPLPNYPKGKIFKKYRGKFIHKSELDGVTLYRLWLYASNSQNKVKRLIAMLSYSLSLLWFFLLHKVPRLVIVQSPPLLVAFTCMLFLKSKKRKLVLNVSDLWPKAGLELGALKEGFYYKTLQRIENYNYKAATIVLGQSQEIIDHVTKLFPNKDTFLYRNYPVFEIPEKTGVIRGGHKLKVVYAGLLGVAQGILKLCDKLDYENIEFHIYGSGSETEQIENYIENHPKLPIFYHGQMDRLNLHKELLQYDLAIIPLLKRIYGSVPSKIFEYAKLGLPMLYFGGGEGELIIKKHKLGWVVSPGHYQHLTQTLNSISNSEPLSKDRIKTIGNEHFNFESQLVQLVKKI